VAHYHGNWLGIGGWSWVQIQTLQATLDPGLPQKYKKRFPVNKKRAGVEPGLPGQDGKPGK